MTCDPLSLTQDALRTPEQPPILPQRYHKTLAHVVPKALPTDVAGAIGEWMTQQRRWLIPVSENDELHEQAANFGWWHQQIDDLAPEFAAAVRACVQQHREVAQAACCVSEFDLSHIEIYTMLHHHGAVEPWHDDVIWNSADAASVEVLETRRISFELTLVVEPAMFEGGHREFSDGKAIAAVHNQLVFWHPAQVHRIRPVECWNSAALHGRWSVRGYVHGPAPNGWKDKMLALRLQRS